MVLTPSSSYLTLYQSSIFSLPVTRASTGARLTHEEVVKQLDNDLIGYDVQLGIGEYFTDLVRIGFRVEKSQYAAGIAWLRDLLYSAEFDIERCVSHFILFGSCRHLILVRMCAGSLA